MYLMFFFMVATIDTVLFNDKNFNHHGQRTLSLCKLRFQKKKSLLGQTLKGGDSDVNHCQCLLLSRCGRRSGDKP